MAEGLRTNSCPFWNTDPSRAAKWRKGSASIPGCLVACLAARAPSRPKTGRYYFAGPERGVSAWILLLTMLASPAWAHKLELFAFANADRIEGWVSGGAATADLRVRLVDAEGTEVASTAPESGGGFSLAVAAPADYLVVVDSADGHRAQWPISATELTPAVATGTAAGSSAAVPAISETRLEAVVDRALVRQLRPLREELVRMQNKLRWSDVLGGIGYIFGLAGLAFWWRGRKP